MTRRVATLALTFLLATGCTAASTTQTETLTHTGCHVNGTLPDPTCTPGEANPAVTQANIGQTICATGWTASIRPSTTYTNKLKVQGIKDYGYTDTALAHYEEDHRVPLEVGGDPSDPRNLWPELGASTKDTIENRVHADVCAGRKTLAQGQAVFLGDWTKG